MQRFMMRPTVIDAIQFDGTAAGVERVISWARSVAPSWPIRPRTEYVGWEDLTGHLEVEVKGVDQGAMGGDWLLITMANGETTVWIINDATFQKYYEPVDG